jgi:hypothetical protein
VFFFETVPLSRAFVEVCESVGGAVFSRAHVTYCDIPFLRGDASTCMRILERMMVPSVLKNLCLESSSARWGMMKPSRVVASFLRTPARLSNQLGQHLPIALEQDRSLYVLSDAALWGFSGCEPLDADFAAGVHQALLTGVHGGCGGRRIEIVASAWLKSHDVTRLSWNSLVPEDITKGTVATGCVFLLFGL